ncbi:C-C chemokine receptor type 6-like [Austrofundulus limnaeus]|uniref:Type-1 angiotensin II receptor n=1 Tax=Austrofundulus limnaeus TaxID=52670 RepID=A0A2I4CY56_AUSLI|nr:PREDICTED: C-C chemokine receptor type 6-like [Austrofundulus limnaeus]
METLLLNQSVYDWEFDEDFTSGELIGPCTFSLNHSVTNVLSLYVHSIICILGFVGNTSVIITYAFYKDTKSMTDVFLLNVAVSDLLFVFALPFIAYSELHSWPMGQVACKLLRGSYSVNLYSGMLLLACISMDRYMAIIHLHSSFRLRLLSYSRLICAVVWVCAVLLSIPTFVFYQWYEPSTRVVFMLETKDEGPSSTAPQYICEMKFEDSETAETVKVAVPSIQMAVGFFLPLVIMMVCYTAIIVTLMKTRNLHQNKEVQVVSVVMVVVVVFITCHLPYNSVLLRDTVSMFKQLSCEEADSWQTALTVTQSIAYLHCCLNPLVYGFIGVKFRKNFKKVFQDLKCLSKQQPFHLVKQRR